MSTDRPNILWICTDQQRFDTIGALGNSHVDTPTIDALCTSGTAFTHAYCQSPICTPSRASFLTGMYPSSIHVTRNGNDYFPVNTPLVTKMFADAGYTCGNIGKLHLASAYKRIEPRADDGYSYFQYSHAPRDNWEKGHDYADWVHSKGHKLSDLTDDLDGVPTEVHQTTWCAEKTIEFMDENQDKPWLLSVNIYDPHPPFNPPTEYRDQFAAEQMPGSHFRDSDLAQQKILESLDFQSKARNPEDLDIKNPIIAKPIIPGGGTEGNSGGDRNVKTLQAAYYAMIKLIDDQLARVVKHLDDTGQRERTIIVFTSDHGETLGDHGLIQKGCRFYEGLVRVPLIFNCPGRIQEGLVNDALVELTDKAPTFLDLCGIDVPDHMHGKSLRSILEGNSNGNSHRDFVRSEYYDALDHAEGTLATMYRDRKYKIVNYHQHEFGELYDLEADPWEFENLWDSEKHEVVKARLMKASFDASMKILDLGPPRVGPM
jgi:arylsulfatase A-like enzyme